MSISPVSRLAAERLWLTYQKSFAGVAGTRSVNDAWETSHYFTANFCISDSATVHEAAKRLISEGVGSLIATDSRNGRMSGIVSERDIVRKVGLLDKDPTKVRVRDIFTPPPKIVMARPRSSLAECIQLIYEYDVYRLPILDEAADIVGMVSVEDCLRVVLEDATTLERISEASKSVEPARLESEL